MSEIAVSVSIPDAVSASVQLDNPSATAAIALILNVNYQTMWLNKQSDDATTLVSGQPTQRVYTSLPDGLALDQMLFLIDNTPVYPSAYNPTTKVVTYGFSIPGSRLIRIQYPIT